MDGNHARVEREVVILNRQGLHARPVLRFVDLASQYEATVEVHKGPRVVDGKSAMEMMLLEGTPGTRLRLVAEGSDAEAAVQALEGLIAAKFYED